MIKRILVGLGGTPFTKVAIRRAVEMAQQHGASVTGVTIVDVNRLSRVGPVPVGASHAAQELGQQRIQVTRERVEEVVALFESERARAKVPGGVRQETGDAFTLFNALWRYHDVVVLGLRGFLDYGVVPEPEDALLKLFASGVRPIVAVSDRYRPIRKVLVAYNGSMDSAKAMKRFAQLRLWPDVRVRLACCHLPEAQAQELLKDAADYLRDHGMEPDAATRRSLRSRGSPGWPGNGRRILSCSRPATEAS